MKVDCGGRWYDSRNCEIRVFSDVDTIEHNLQAYLLAYSHHINLTNVSASNTSYGVQSYRSNRNVIANGSFYRNHHAIYLDNSDYTTISNISSRENYGREPRTGVYLYESHHNLITNNTTVSSNRPGIRLEYSYYNTISHCNLTKSVVGGIAILYGGSNNISRCDMTENEHGVYIMGSPSNNITNNTIHNNTKGVWIFGTFSKNNLMANNEIANNSEFGILMEVAGIQIEPLHNMVILNNITSNGGYAVKIKGTDNRGNWIHHNNMICNKGNCSDGYQGYDEYDPPVDPGDPNLWNDSAIGNFWTLESWGRNGGWIEGTYYVDPLGAGTAKDHHPQYGSFFDAGPQS